MGRTAGTQVVGGWSRMKSILSLPGLWPINLFLVASLGPLVIFRGNLNRIMIETTVSGILILLVVLVGLRMLLAVVFRRPSITDPLVVLFVLCGFYNSLFSSDRSTLLFWGWQVIVVLPIPLLFISPSMRQVLPKALCLFLGIMNGIMIVNIVQHDVWGRRSALRAVLGAHYPPLQANGEAVTSSRPDIYYIIFDRYARADQLARVYDFDNSNFLDTLRKRGFQVSGRSYSAYQRTAHSLASTLNLDYLPAANGPSSNDWIPLYEQLRAPRLYSFLKAEGYRIVTMGSWWEPTRTSQLADRNDSYFAVPESLRPMVEGSAFLRGLGRMGITWLDPRERHCARIKHKFEALKQAGSAAEPVFVFAHFLIPHPPYVIDADGVFKTVDDAHASSRRSNYIAQLEYTNKAALDLIDVLIDQNPKAVIILQSDEGPWPDAYAGEEITRFGEDVTPVDWNAIAPDDLREKMAILNAMRLPGKPAALIGDGFSPVNTFRVILREYFGLPLQDLETRNWVFVSDNSLWQFRDVQEELMGKESR